MRVLIAGAGVIGQGWAIRFALFGWDVLIYDQDSDAGRRCAAQIERVRDMSKRSIQIFRAPDK